MEASSPRAAGTGSFARRGRGGSKELETARRGDRSAARRARRRRAAAGARSGPPGRVEQQDLQERLCGPGSGRGGAAGRARRGVCSRRSREAKASAKDDRAVADVPARGPAKRAQRPWRPSRGSAALASRPGAAPPPDEPPDRRAPARRDALLETARGGLRQKLDDLERGIEATPEDDEIGQVVEQFKAATARHSALESRERSGSMRRSLP